MTPPKITKLDALHTGCVGYFPNALAAIGRWSVKANAKHNPGEPVGWAFGKSTQHLDAALSHLTDPYGIDEESGEIHLVNAAWRVLAALETHLINQGAKPGMSVRDAPEPTPPTRWRIERLTSTGDWVQSSDLDDTYTDRAEAERVIAGFVLSGRAGCIQYRTAAC